MKILNVSMEDHIAVVSIDQQGSDINTINKKLISEFRDFLAFAEENTAKENTARERTIEGNTVADGLRNPDTIKAIVLISGKRDRFIAGADIRLFLGFREEEDALAFSREGNLLLSRLQALPVPVIAAIHGAANGGGMEVALACHYRVATDHPSTFFALPEVKLGLCPAAGGTQRLPALVGITTALPLLLTGRKVSSREALKIGLVNELVPVESLLSAALKIAANLTAEPENRNTLLSKITGSGQAGEAADRKTAKEIRKMASNAPAVHTETGKGEKPFGGDEKTAGRDKNPLGEGGKPFGGGIRIPLFSRAAQVIRGGILGNHPVFAQTKKDLRSSTRGLYPAPYAILDCVKHGLTNGLKQGLEYESRLFSSLAMTTESRNLIYNYLAKRSARRNPSRVRPVAVKRIGVLGAGLMGSGITSVSARHGFGVTVRDRDLASAVRARQTAWNDLNNMASAQIITEFERDRILSGIRLTDNYADFSGLPMIIEAVNEDIQVKHAVLKQTEAVISDDAIFATNTSAIPISQIARASKRPERVIGMHYFSPAGRMPLVEIIKGEKTSEVVVATACDVALRQGKSVIVVGDSPGFYVTRILVPMINEAMLLVEEGADIRIVDLAIKNFGFPVGPVALVDEAGIDIAAHVFEIMNPLFKERGCRVSQSLHRLHENGYAGRKNRRGFYNYRNSKKLPDTDVYSFFGGKQRRDISLDEITERIILVMINESLFCLQDGIIRDPKAGDIGAVLGMGFPPFRGGPFRYVDETGAKQLWDRLQYRHNLHGVRFKPAELLSEYVKKKKTFHS